MWNGLEFILTLLCRRGLSYAGCISCRDLKPLPKICASWVWRYTAHDREIPFQGYQRIVESSFPGPLLFEVEVPVEDLSIFQIDLFESNAYSIGPYAIKKKFLQSKIIKIQIWTYTEQDFLILRHKHWYTVKINPSFTHCTGPLA